MEAVVSAVAGAILCCALLIGGPNDPTRAELEDTPKLNISHVMYCALRTCGKLEQGMTIVHQGMLISVKALAVRGNFVVEGRTLSLTVNIKAPRDASQHASFYNVPQLGDSLTVEATLYKDTFYALRIQVIRQGAVSCILQKHGLPKDNFTPHEYTALIEAIDSLDMNEVDSKEFRNHYFRGKSVKWEGVITSVRTSEVVFVSVGNAPSGLANVVLEGQCLVNARVGTSVSFTAEVVEAGRPSPRLKVHQFEEIATEFLYMPVSSPCVVCSHSRRPS